MRRCKQLFRNEYRALRMSYGKSTDAVSLKAQRTSGLGRLRLRIQHLKGLYAASKRGYFSSEKTTSNPYVRVFFRCSEDIAQDDRPDAEAWAAIVRATGLTHTKMGKWPKPDPKDKHPTVYTGADGFGFSDRMAHKYAGEKYAELSPWRAPGHDAAVGEDAAMYEEYSGMVGITEVVTQQIDDITFANNDFEILLAQPTVRSNIDGVVNVRPTSWSTMSGQLCVQVRSATRKGLDDTDIGHVIINLEELVDTNKGSPSAPNYVPALSLEAAQRYDPHTGFHWGKQRVHRRTLRIQPPPQARDFQLERGNIQLTLQVTLPLAQDIEMLNMAGEEELRRKDVVPFPSPGTPEYARDWSVMEAPMPPHQVADLLASHEVTHEDMSHLTPEDWSLFFWGSERFLCNDDVVGHPNTGRPRNAFAPVELDGTRTRVLRQAQLLPYPAQLDLLAADEMSPPKEMPLPPARKAYLNKTNRGGGGARKYTQSGDAAGKLGGERYYDPLVLPLVRQAFSTPTGEHQAQVCELSMFKRKTLAERARAGVADKSALMPTPEWRAIPWHEVTKPLRNPDSFDPTKLRGKAMSHPGLLLHSDTVEGGRKIAHAVREVRDHMALQLDEIGAKCVNARRRIAGFEKRIETMVDPRYTEYCSPRKREGVLVFTVPRARDLWNNRPGKRCDPFVRIAIGESGHSMSTAETVAVDAREQQISSEEEEARHLSTKDVSCVSHKDTNTTSPDWTTGGAHGKYEFHVPVFTRGEAMQEASWRNTGATTDCQVRLGVWNGGDVTTDASFMGETSLNVHDLIVEGSRAMGTHNLEARHEVDVLTSDNHTDLANSTKHALASGSRRRLQKEASKRGGVTGTASFIAATREYSAKLITYGTLDYAVEYRPDVADDGEAKGEAKGEGESKVASMAAQGGKQLAARAQAIAHELQLRVAKRKRAGNANVEARDEMLRSVKENFEADYFKYCKPPAIGQLTVSLLSAKGLPQMDVPSGEDVFGASDPFAFIELDGKIHRTPTIVDTCNPVWSGEGSEYTFPVSSDTSTLKISLWDDDGDQYSVDIKTVTAATDPVPLGEVNIPFSQFAEEHEVLRNFPLRADSHKKSRKQQEYSDLATELEHAYDVLREIDTGRAQGLSAKDREEARTAYDRLDVRMKTMNGFFRPDFSDVVHLQFDPTKGDKAASKLAYGAHYYPRPVPAMQTNPQGSIRVKLQYVPLLDATDVSGRLVPTKFAKHVRPPFQHPDFPGAVERRSAVVAQTRMLRNQLQDQLVKHASLPRRIREIFGKSFARHNDWTAERGGDLDHRAVVLVEVIGCRDLSISNPESQAAAEQLGHDPYVVLRIDGPNNGGATSSRRIGCDDEGKTDGAAGAAADGEAKMSRSTSIIVREAETLVAQRRKTGLLTSGGLLRDNFTRADVLEIFESIDRNHDGQITPLEMIKALRSDPSMAYALRMPVMIREGETHASFEARWLEMDKDADRVIDFDEFVSSFVREDIISVDGGEGGSGGSGEVALKEAEARLKRRVQLVHAPTSAEGPRSRSKGQNAQTRAVGSEEDGSDVHLVGRPQVTFSERIEWDHDRGTTSTAVWGEKFEFNVRDVRHADLEISVYDRDQSFGRTTVDTTRDGFMGGSSIKLADVVDAVDHFKDESDRRERAQFERKSMSAAQRAAASPELPALRCKVAYDSMWLPIRGGRTATGGSRRFDGTSYDCHVENDASGNPMNHKTIELAYPLKPLKAGHSSNVSGELLLRISVCTPLRDEAAHARGAVRPTQFQACTEVAEAKAKLASSVRPRVEAEMGRWLSFVARRSLIAALRTVASEVGKALVLTTKREPHVGMEADGEIFMVDDLDLRFLGHGIIMRAPAMIGWRAVSMPQLLLIWGGGAKAAKVMKSLGAASASESADDAGTPADSSSVLKTDYVFRPEKASGRYPVATFMYNSEQTTLLALQSFAKCHGVHFAKARGTARRQRKFENMGMGTRRGDAGGACAAAAAIVTATTAATDGDKSKQQGFTTPRDKGATLLDSLEDDDDRMFEREMKDRAQLAIRDAGETKGDSKGESKGGRGGEGEDDPLVEHKNPMHARRMGAHTREPITPGLWETPFGKGRSVAQNTDSGGLKILLGWGTVYTADAHAVVSAGSTPESAADAAVESVGDGGSVSGSDADGDAGETFWIDDDDDMDTPSRALYVFGPRVSMGLHGLDDALEDRAEKEGAVEAALVALAKAVDDSEVLTAKLSLKAADAALAKLDKLHPQLEVIIAGETVQILGNIHDTAVGVAHATTLSSTHADPHSVAIAGNVIGWISTDLTALLGSVTTCQEDYLATAVTYDGSGADVGDVGSRRVFTFGGVNLYFEWDRVFCERAELAGRRGSGAGETKESKESKGGLLDMSNGGVLRPEGKESGVTGAGAVRWHDVTGAGADETVQSLISIVMENGHWVCPSGQGEEDTDSPVQIAPSDIGGMRGRGSGGGGGKVSGAFPMVPEVVQVHGGEESAETHLTNCWLASNDYSQIFGAPGCDFDRANDDVEGMKTLVEKALRDGHPHEKEMADMASQVARGVQDHFTAAKMNSMAAYYIEVVEVHPGAKASAAVSLGAFAVTPGSTVRQLKERIECLKGGLPASMQILEYGGCDASHHKLEALEDHRTLADYKITPNLGQISLHEGQHLTGQHGGDRLPIVLDQFMNNEEIKKGSWTQLARTLYTKTRILEGHHATGSVFATVATHHADSTDPLSEWGYESGSNLRRRVWHTVYLCTRLEKLNVERRGLEKVVRSKSALVDDLGPASHEQGLLMCEVLHKRYNEMLRQLVDVKAEHAAAKKQRWGLVQENNENSLEKHAAIAHLQHHLHAAQEVKRDLRA
jgi:hypothetical protein